MDHNITIIDDLLKYHDRIDMMTFEFHWVDKNLKVLKNASLIYKHKK